MENKKTGTKLKPAKKYASKEKVNEEVERMENVSSSVSSASSTPEQASDAEEQIDDADVIIPKCNPDSMPSDIPETSQVTGEESELLLSDITLKEFCIAFETTLITILNNREEAQRKALEEEIKQKKTEGITIVTPENALVTCTEYMNAIGKDYNLYKTHRNAIDRQQTKDAEIAKQQGENIKRLETVVGRIEKVQGVKAPKRPPFPSWACLAYLLWHWPMYAFAYLWLSKYFRRFCFLITFFVIVIQFCLICLLASDNRTMHYNRDKYCIVRNWSYVLNDTSAVNRFNKVDLLFEDIKLNEEKIKGLNNFIYTKYGQNLKHPK